MELAQMETFLAVAEERSFSRAASRLHRTQPAISQTIAKLEAELGEVLFERSSRDGTLTAAGALLRDYAVKMLNLRGEARGCAGGAAGAAYGAADDCGERVHLPVFAAVAFE